jgi:hypothetical protein
VSVIARRVASRSAIAWPRWRRADDLRADDDHEQEHGRDATLTGGHGTRGEHEGKREQHRCQTAAPGGDEVGGERLHRDAADREECGAVGDDEPRPGGHQPGGEQRAPARERQRHRRHQVGDDRVLAA